MSIPMKNGGMSKIRALVYTMLSGVTTGIGAFFGALAGQISEGMISLCLAVAAGAMLYIVSGELIPESNSLYKGRIGFVGNILGFILGILAFNLWWASFKLYILKTRLDPWVNIKKYLTYNQIYVKIDLAIANRSSNNWA